jgi:ferredoxin-NADP reductase
VKFTLVDKRTEVPGVESFTFEPSEPLTWKAGQYAHYRLPHEAPDDRGIERWFTLSSAPFEKHPAITTRFAPEKGSTFKQALAALKVGDSIESDYVDGDFTVDDGAQEYVFLAGGIGITPFHSILKEAEHGGVKLKVTLIYANRDENVVFKNELDAWAQHNPDLKIHYLTAPERIDEQAIVARVPDLQKPLFYISGPEPMVKSLGEVLEGMGVSTDRIKLDDFPGYPAE